MNLFELKRISKELNQRLLVFYLCIRRNSYQTILYTNLKNKLGFGGIAGAAAGIAKIVFFIFIVLFVISLITGRRKV